jgi:hypothetical protein
MVMTFITGDVFAVGAYEILLTRIVAVAAGSPAEVASYEVAIRP